MLLSSWCECMFSNPMMATKQPSSKLKDALFLLLVFIVFDCSRGRTLEGITSDNFSWMFLVTTANRSPNKCWQVWLYYLAVYRKVHILYTVSMMCNSYEGKVTETFLFSIAIWINKRKGLKCFWCMIFVLFCCLTWKLTGKTCFPCLFCKILQSMLLLHLCQT